MDSVTPTPPTPTSPPVTIRDVVRIVHRRASLALVTFCVVVGATLALTSLMKPVYEAKARVLVDDPGRGALPQSILDLLSSSRSTSLDTQVAILESRKVLSEVIRKGNLATTPEELTGRLRLEPVNQVLNIAVRARTGEEAADTANLLSRIFVWVVQDQEERSANQATQKVRATLRRTQQEKTDAQTAMNDFMKSAGNVNPAAQFESRATQTEQLRQELDKARNSLRVEQRRREGLAADAQRIAPAIQTGFTQTKNPAIDQYEFQLYELQRQRREKRMDFTEDSPEIREIDTKIAAVNAGLRRAYENVYSKGSIGVSRNPDYSTAISGLIGSNLAIQTLQTGIRANEALLQQREAEQEVLADRKSRYEELQRRLASAVGKYEQLRKGITEIDVRRSTAVPNVEILDAAIVPPVPISPKPVLNALMALFLGGFLAVAVALMAEYLSAAEQEELTAGLPQVAGVPLLGTVPVALPAPAGGSLPVPVTQSVRAEDTLREVGYGLANLRHDPRKPAPVVLLAGTRTDESTAAVAAQLAATLIRDGLRVTLVDADRAHPRLNRVFGAPDAPGVADVLAGRARVQDILHVGADGRLRFLAAGSPDDTTPATERALRRLFKDLGGDTDLVLVSGPSVWGARVVAPLERAADGLVLVAPPDAPAGESVARARRLLTNGSQPHILGVVVSEPMNPAAARETTA